jgi:hypothetical protein
LQRKIRSIVDNSVIATNCKLSLITNPEVKIQNQSNFTMDIGNVTLEQDHTFKLTIPSKFNQKNIPIQAQISFTDSEGSQKVRVITKSIELSTDPKKCEEEVDVSLLSLFALQESSRIALSTNFESGLLHLLSYSRLFMRCSKTSIQLEELANFKQFSEPLKSELMKQMKSKEISDMTTKVLHQSKISTRTQFLSGFRKKNIVQKRKNHTKDISLLSKIEMSNKLKKEMEKQKELEEELEKEIQSKTCIVCEDKKINCVLIPCGHQTLCDGCASQLNQCPICRQKVNQIVKTFGR